MNQRPDNFFEAVYALVATIPEGTVVSYVQLARALGKPRGARAVGYAMRSAPESRSLPCHRVVNQQGALAPAHAFGGAEVQRGLLESEGVAFGENGRVDMVRHQWPGI